MTETVMGAKVRGYIYAVQPSNPSWRDPSWPLVSVSVVTYNQVDLLGRALDSILDQRVDFAYEIVIGDDGSDDGTVDVIRSYQARFPDRIVPILHPRRNEGRPARINIATNLAACRGRYTAWLDGDDYWREPEKLARQVAVLEANPGLGCALHASEVRYESGDPPTEIGLDHPEGVVPAAAFFRQRPLSFHSSSWVFRTRCYGELPERWFSVVAGDYYLFLLILECGDAYYFPECWSVYHKRSVSLTERSDYLGRAALHDQLDDLRHYRDRFPAAAASPGYARYAARYHLALLKIALSQRDWSAALRHGGQLVSADPALALRAIKRYFAA